MTNPSVRTAALFVVIALPLAAIAWLGTRELPQFRVEIGATEDGYLIGNDSSWGRAYRDQAPVRIRRGVRRRSFFAARMAFPESGFAIPARPMEGGGRLSLRIHRYGHPGVLKVFGNGLELESILLQKDRYPWAVHEISVPARVFRESGLLIELRGEELESAPDLEPEALVAFDWVELGSESPRGTVSLDLPSRLWLVSVPVVIAALVFLLTNLCRISWRWWVTAVGGGAALAGLLWSFTAAPAATLAFARHMPPFLVLGLGIVTVVRWFGMAPARAKCLASLVTLVTLAHGTILFFPDHQPPDLGPHLGQVRTLNSLSLERDSLLDFSASFGETGRGKPHFGVDYRAPYPPWSYFLIHLLRSFLNEPRFWLEFLGVACGGMLVGLVFILTERIASIPHAGWFAAFVASLEISIWHHASRAHTPGLVGQVALMVMVLYLLRRYDKLSSWRSWLVLMLLSFVATIAYTATLFHVVLLIFVYTVFSVVANRRLTGDGKTWFVVTACAAGTVASLGVFYGHFVTSALSRSSEILAESGYRAPGTFWFLRNQMRDTVRILSGGYPWFVLLAVPALVRLRRWTRGAPGLLLLAAWAATYVFMLVLKDPAVLPQLFLHAKEDLFFAPAIAVLGGMSLAAAWRTHRVGQVAVILVLAGLAYLQVLDFAFNSDMITPWSLTQMAS